MTCVKLLGDQSETKLLGDANRNYLIERAVADYEAALKAAPEALPKLEAEQRRLRKELARLAAAGAEGCYGRNRPP